MWTDEKLNWPQDRSPPGLLLERSPGGKEGPDHVTFTESQMSKVSVVICWLRSLSPTKKASIATGYLIWGQEWFVDSTHLERMWMHCHWRKKHHQTAPRRHIRSKKEVCTRGNEQRERDVESWYPFRDGLMYMREVVQAIIFSLWTHRGDRETYFHPFSCQKLSRYNSCPKSSMPVSHRSHGRLYATSISVYSLAF